MAKAAKEETTKIDSSEITILPKEVEKKVNAEIGLIRVEANVTDEVIKTLKEEYGGLAIKDQTDKEGYLAVQEARKHVKKIRVAAGKLFDKGRQEAVAVADKWLVNKKKVIDALAAIETPLEEKEDAYEAEDKRIKDEKALKTEQQGIRRTSGLMSYGASLIDGNWVLGDLAYESVLCKNSDEDIYEGIRDQFKAIFDVNEKAKADKAEEDRLAAEKLLKDQQDLAKQQAEVKKMRTEGRVSFLESLGMKKNVMGNAWVYANQFVKKEEIEEKESQDWEVIIAGVKSGVEEAKELAKRAEQNRIIFDDRFVRLKEWSSNGQSVYSKGSQWGTTADIIDMSEEDFEKLVAENDKYLAAREDEKRKQKEKELEDARLEGIGKSRRQMLTEIQCVFTKSDKELGEMGDAPWNKLYKDAKEISDNDLKEKADQAEKERQELLGEKQRYEEYGAKLKAIPIPEFRSGQYRAKITTIRAFIEGLK